MRRWMKVVFCFLFGIIFTNMFTMDQAVADESFGKREISAESSVLTQKKQAVLDMETMTFSLESEADEDGDTISKGMILTTAGITSDTYPAVLTKSDEMFKKAAAISERSKVELTVGEEIYYGNYSTNYFDVNGKPAYCLEPLKDTPNSGSYETQALTGGAVRKGLYYAYGGPGYELYRAKYGAIGIGENYSVNDEYCMSHCILSYLYMGTEEAFVYDTYIVSEKKAPEGLTPVGDFEITIEEDAKTLYYILENKKIFSPVKLVKKDSETEKIIPVAGAVFRLLDKDKKPITMTTHYPNESVYDLFKTDENGSFVLPEKLPAGNYYFQEVEAPQGYLIEDGLIPFTIIENHDWEKPFIVESKDRPAKGRIYIQKNDSVTEKGISGVKFEIKAAEDICTPDGTVRVEKGTVVGSLVTDQSGKAWSEELYLGTYEIIETKQAEGYILPEKSVEIELEYEGQDVPVVTKETEILNKPTSVVIRKSDGETKKALSGVKFELREKISEINEESDAEEEDLSEEKTTYITDENGEIHLSYLRPGVYCLYESEPLTGYIKNEEVWEFQIREDGTVEGEQEKILEIENHHTRITDTHAVWKESKAKEIIAGEEHIICDTVNFKYMEANASYTMKGILMDADTGKELLQDGKPVTSEKTFKGKDAKDGITMEFDVDSRKFPGKRIVVFEVLYLGDCLIDAHRDLRNQEQTVSILKKEEVTVKTGDNKVYMKQTILIMSASVCILYATWKRKKRRH